MNSDRPPAVVRRVSVNEIPVALEILREAATWALARGVNVWAPHELRERDFEPPARADELVLGYAGATPVATMLLQSVDRKYWPEAVADEALYLHKVAVRRTAAGQGWLGRLISFATDDARARGIGRLRLDTLAHPGLRGLYERHGFRALPEAPLTVGGRRMIRMERVLDPASGTDRPTPRR
ncbi:MAG: GNAT family N-acetyltransferase [Proteobacteria bacterium]|nr:GNAT family N-acetyltransferase [Pseudomonadota bacterium]